MALIVVLFSQRWLSVLNLKFFIKGAITQVVLRKQHVYNY